MTVPSSFVVICPSASRITSVQVILRYGQKWPVHCDCEVTERVFGESFSRFWGKRKDYKYERLMYD